MRQLKIQNAPTFRTDESLSKYLSDINRLPMITPNEEVELIRKAHKGGIEGQQAKEKLINANLRFVVSVAKQYQHQGLTLIDLINEGNIGLMTAVEKFDETYGFKFISYAVWWIRESILQAINDYGRIVRIPLNKTTMLNKISKVISKYEQENQYLPSISDLAELVNENEETIYSVMEVDKQSISTDSPVQDGDITLGDTLTDTEESKDLESLSVELNLCIDKILNNREANILRTYFEWQIQNII